VSITTLSVFEYKCAEHNWKERINEDSFEENE